MSRLTDLQDLFAKIEAPAFVNPIKVRAGFRCKQHGCRMRAGEIWYCPQCRREDALYNKEKE